MSDRYTPFTTPLTDADLRAIGQAAQRDLWKTIRKKQGQQQQCQRADDGEKQQAVEEAPHG